MAEVKKLKLAVENSAVAVSAVSLQPNRARLILALAHGAGAGMLHSFMESMAQALAGREVATLRYNFPYIEEGRRRPDPPHLLEATVRSAVGVAYGAAGGLPLLAGGKSLGGRMTSSAAAQGSLSGTRGLVFLGFPLHPPGKEGKRRAEHLRHVDVPMLFLQGTRDRLARLDLIEEVCDELGPRATLRVIDGADHSFAVPKRSGRSADEVHAELAVAIRDWGLSLK